MEKDDKDTIEKQFNTCIRSLISTKESDIFLFVGEISDINADKLIELVRSVKDRKKNCSFILTTFGGDPDAGYRIARYLKRKYEKLILYVFGYCKSTGTLIALGADEIVMGDFGEFGPLDIQMVRDDELSNMSGLNFVQSLISLNNQIFQSFTANFIALKEISSYTITTKTAAEIATKLSVGLIAPISAQIEPVKLGEVNRSIKIANDYGKRICKNSELINTLITNYPSHSFVIDYVEAKEIFENVRLAEDLELKVEAFLFNIVRKEKRDDQAIIKFLDPPEPEPEPAIEPVIEKNNSGLTEEPLPSRPQTYPLN